MNASFLRPDLSRFDGLTVVVAPAYADSVAPDRPASATKLFAGGELTTAEREEFLTYLYGTLHAKSLDEILPSYTRFDYRDDGNSGPGLRFDAAAAEEAIEAGDAVLEIADAGEAVTIRSRDGRRIYSVGSSD
jgi:hypothetical protein